jgi:hypothetical protein
LDVQVYLVKPERWPDIENHFGSKGAYSNYYCTYWNLKRLAITQTTN